MISALILARGFSPIEFASYSYFQLTASMIAAYSTMGLGVAATKIFAEFGQTGRESKIGSLWWISSGLSIVFAIAVLFIPQSWIGADLPVPRWIFSLGVLAFSLNIVPSNAILGLEKYREAALMSALSGASMILGALWFSNANNSAGAICVLIGSVFLHAAGQSMVIIRAVTLKNLLSSNFLRAVDLREILNLVAPMLLVTLLAASGTWILGRMILNLSNGHRLFSLYAIGLQWFSFSLLLPGVLSKVLLPRFVRMQNPGKNEEAKKLARTSVFISLAISVVVLALGFAFNDSIGRLYKISANASEYFVVAYLAAAVFVAPINVIGSSFIANGLHRYWLLLTCGWFLVLLGGGRVFREMASGMGPMALGVSYGLFAISAYFLARRKHLV